MDERNAQGQFAAGHKGSGGRPSKARELAYLAVIAEEVTLDDFRAVIRQAKADAVRGEDGRARDYGRRWLADYLIGRPRQTLHINTGTGASDAYDELSDDALHAIIAAETAADAGADAERGASARDPGGAHTPTG